MQYLLICLTSFLVSFLALFSGFGLGTVLMPVFALFFPLPIAIASTAVVHLANNIFKGAIVGKLANWNVVIRFGIPAALASAWGAFLLKYLSSLPVFTSYTIGSHTFKITYLGFIVGLIIILSSLFELIPQISKLTFPSKYTPLGGAISGFFGGISGNQGVLRSAFLIKAGLNKEEYIGTSAVISIIVDVVRLLVYGWTFSMPSDTRGIILAASLTAILGSYIASRYIEKVTFKTVQVIVGLMLFVLGMALALGLI